MSTLLKNITRTKHSFSLHEPSSWSNVMCCSKSPDAVSSPSHDNPCPVIRSASNHLSSTCLTNWSIQGRARYKQSIRITPPSFRNKITTYVMHHPLITKKSFTPAIDTYIGTSEQNSGITTLRQFYLPTRQLVLSARRGSYPRRKRQRGTPCGLVFLG